MGFAYLPDGTRMDYSEYIKTHPHWQTVRRARYKFDNGQCAICHESLPENGYQTHHMSYLHLGNERMVEVTTLCNRCHTMFHRNWSKQEFWKGKESGHWEVFDIRHTAMLCHTYYKDDKLINKDPDAPNLCSKETQKEYIDRYFREFNISDHVAIDPNDIGLFVRNKRYELFFEANERGLNVEQFLDEYYGQKVRGKNPIRQEAGKKGGVFDHKPESFRKHYKENPNLNRLMREVKRIERHGEVL